MKLYGAIDLHSTNNVTVLIDEEDKMVYQGCGMRVRMRVRLA